MNVNPVLIACVAGFLWGASHMRGEEPVAPEPLIAAVEARDLAGVRRALAGGASPDTRAPDGKTALIRAAQLGETDIGLALLKAGADLSLKSPAGNPLLIFIAEGGSIPLAKEALARKLPVNAISPQNADTALIIAAEHDRVELVRLLLEHGADPNIGVRRDSLGRFAPALSLAAWTASPGVIDLLLKAGADPSKPNNMGDLPIHYAARGGNLENVRHLLKLGADVHSRNHEGVEPMTMAAYNGFVEIVRILVGNGGDPEQALREAIHTGQTEVADYLRSVVAKKPGPGTGTAARPAPTPSTSVFQWDR